MQHIRNKRQQLLYKMMIPELVYASRNKDYAENNRKRCVEKETKYFVLFIAILAICVP